MMNIEKNILNNWLLYHAEIGVEMVVAHNHKNDRVLSCMEAQKIFIDNEYSTFNSIYINGIEGTVATHPTGYNRLIISVNGIQYNISGFVESDEIIKIYENIKISL